MTREEFIGMANGKLKLVRTEYGYPQEKMAVILGMSKKTLIEIEKGRASLGWQGAVMLCTVFYQSEVLGATFGGRTADMILALAFNGNEPVYPKTMGGKVWWRTLESKEGWQLQQNIISQHFRLLDDSDRRVCSSFRFGDVKERMEEQITGK